MWCHSKIPAIKIILIKRKIKREYISIKTDCISIFAAPLFNHCFRKLARFADSNSAYAMVAMLTKMTKCCLLFVIIYISLFFVFYFNPNCRSLVVSVQRCASVCALSTTEMHFLSPFFPTDTRHFPAAPVLPVFRPLQQS